MRNFIPPRFYRPFKYLVSGGTAAVVNIGTMFVLTHLLSVWYLLASVLGFVLSFVVSFVLQRHWTFEVEGRDGITTHMAQYFAIALANLAINTGIVYGLVEWCGVWSVGAQLVAGVVVSFESFFVYRYIFRA